MGQITISGGHIVLYDDEDEHIIKGSTWTPRRVGKLNQMYVCRGSPPQTFMHRIIMGCEDKSLVVDHKNHNGLDNRKSNLRICTKGQNCANRTSAKNSTSKYLGVCKKKNRWRAQITVNKRTKYIGAFRTQEEAAIAYNEAAKNIHGEFANLNVL